MNVLEVRNVNKSFKDKTVLKNISFDIKAGEIVGLVGRNGSGKSTLMKIIACLMECDSGEVSICDTNMKENREKSLSHMSVMIEGPSLYSNFSVQEHLKLNAYLRNVDQTRLQSSYDYLGFEKKQFTKKIKKLSMGMKQEVGLAICFMNDVELYILDEPINGLDFDNIVKFRNKIMELKELNKTVLISSHILRELEIVVDRFLFLHEATLVEVDKNEVFDIEKKYEEILHG